MADQTLQTLHSYLQPRDIDVEPDVTVRGYSHDTGSSHVLLAIHGYPESSYIWRHVVPLVKDRISLFIPELPGYGISSLPPQSDKRTVGNLIIKALQTVFGTERKVIICGHDRGARIAHRLLVDDDPAHNIVSGVLLDIVPTLEQFRVFSDPKASVAFYHWSFLAVDSAPSLIEAMGGGHIWVRMMLDRTKGGNDAGLVKFEENGAIEHYCHQFSKPEGVVGSCADYAAGATVDCEEQKRDQEIGRKVKLPLLVMYSASYLGRTHNVPDVWGQWATGELKTVGVTDGYGHYLPEECPNIVAEHVLEWLDHVGA